MSDLSLINIAEVIVDVNPTHKHIDLTGQTQIWGNQANWTPTHDLDSRQHSVSITARGQSGHHYSDSWSFNVPEQHQVQAAQVKAYGPAPGTVVTVRRPTMTCIFANSIKRTKATILVDGHDVTASSNIETDRVSWTPGYDLDYGQHLVRVIISNRNGQESVATWTYIIGR